MPRRSMCFGGNGAGLATRPTRKVRRLDTDRRAAAPMASAGPKCPWAPSRTPGFRPASSPLPLRSTERAGAAPTVSLCTHHTGRSAAMASKGRGAVIGRGCRGGRPHCAPTVRRRPRWRLHAPFVPYARCRHVEPSSPGRASPLFFVRHRGVGGRMRRKPGAGRKGGGPSGLDVHGWPPRRTRPA